ncbi:MAG TPA: hypothetical protein DGZ34_00305 [Lachnospiraceae bacterium]|nr:hypothetical protein [Lachnospiraceae bacterium]
MMLSDIRDYIAGLNMAEQCYMGKLDAKKDNSIGCYHLRRSGSSHIPLGGRSNATYDILPVSILIHGSRYAVETERMAHKLYQVLRDLENETVNNQTIKFCRMLVPEPQDVGTDDNGIYEMVIETELYTEKEEE